jgi:hypothetical protein
LVLFFASVNFLSAQVNDEDEGESKARAVIQKAIEAMGGDAYLNVNNYHQSGRYFGFRKGRKSFARYQDWTVYEPIKSRTQFGKGDSQYVQIYNLELKQGWTLEGKDIVEEIKPELIEDFYTNTVKRDMDYILKKRLNEEGMSFFYYSPDEVAGGGNFEAVEILDETNYSIVVFFDLDTHLPAKVENYSTDDVGVRHKRERELANWHVIQNVNVPLRSDYYTDGELSAQWFIEEIQFNLQMPADFFLEPQIDE